MPSLSVPKDPVICANFVGGEWQNPAPGSSFREVLSPYTQKPIGKVVLSRKPEVDTVVEQAKAVATEWAKTPIKERSGHLFQFRKLLLENMQDLANTAALEAGKTFGEAKAGIEKGIEVLEFALSLQNADDGGALDVSRGVSCEYRRVPLGVVAGIVPFNFPAMVPMWMFPIAVTLGNCFVMKPSEKVPLTLHKIADLMDKAGFPKGVFSLLNGDKTTAELLIDHPDVQAIAFVGSTPAARAVYQRTTNLGKRCLALGGAKNYLILVPDADETLTVKGVVDSFTGCAGQRCMAASLMVAVGNCDNLIEKIVKHAATLELGKHMGAIIDVDAKARIVKAIEQAEKQGAKILLDGRKAKPPHDYPGGLWLGPTVIDHVQPEFDCAKSEIFGPVLSIVRKKTLPEAMGLEHSNMYGNATSIFTTNGAVAKYVTENASSGMVGVNIGVPVPREPFSFGGTKASKFGHGDITGKSVLDFWTQLKKITTKWQSSQDANWMS